MRSRLAARATGVFALAVGTVAALTAPASAVTQPLIPVPGADGPLAALQRDLGLTLEQAQQRLAQEASANRLNQTLQTALSGAFGGSYFDAGLGKLVVGVTDPSKVDQVKAAGGEARVVPYSASSLNDAATGLRSHSTTAPKSVSGWYVSNRDDSVVLTTARGGAAQAADFIRTAGVDAQKVKIVESNEAPRTLADVIGGNAYYIGSGARCSIGFSVADGFISAGHCGKQGDTTTQPNGTFVGSSFPGNDYSHIKVAAGETPQPLVNDYKGGTVSVAGSTAAAEGASVCRSGSTSGWHCGTIQAKNQSVQYPEGTVSGLTRTNACAEPGDSGGSWLAGDQAQGVTSGGSGDCTTGGTTYFQPVNEILQAYGLRLLTK